MKFKPEWVDAELEVSSHQNGTVIGRSGEDNTTERTEENRELEVANDSVATIIPTQAD